MSKRALHPTGEPASRSDVRLENRVYGELVAKIRDGELVFGERLPSEVDLAASFGVSRPIVRAALSILRDEGLIVSRRGAGSYVSIDVPEAGSGFAPLDGIDDISAVFQFRRMLESEAAALAAPRTTAEDIVLLKTCAGDMESLLGAGAGTAELDLKFHLKIAELSDNRFIYEGLEMLRPHLMFIAKIIRTLSPRRYEYGKVQMNREHQQIILALEQGNATGARSAMTTHIDSSQRRVFKGEK